MYKYEYVQEYDTNGESEDEKLSTKKKKVERKIWMFEKKFENAKDAEELIHAENTWSITTTHETEDGTKRYYRCNKVKRRGPQCAAQKYLLFEANSDSVFLYSTASKHDHESIGNKRELALHRETKEKINQLFALHLKPKAIMYNLRKTKGIAVPSMTQLNNYLYSYRKSAYRS